MAEIKWERDYQGALERAKKERKPIWHDFWYEG